MRICPKCNVETDVWICPQKHGTLPLRSSGAMAAQGASLALFAMFMGGFVGRIFASPPPPPDKAWIIAVITLFFPAILVGLAVYELMRASSWERTGGAAARLSPGIRIRSLTLIGTMVALVLISLATGLLRGPARTSVGSQLRDLPRVQPHLQRDCSAWGPPGPEAALAA